LKSHLQIAAAAVHFLVSYFSILRKTIKRKRSS